VPSGGEEDADDACVWTRDISGDKLLLSGTDLELEPGMGIGSDISSIVRV
jgi:hypothetical protein